jgi:oxaloacetate decarboxylase alpha subunit/pyruvate carboxylase subunit B
MIPVAEMMDDVGFWAMETWGGATFDAMHRFLNEDPWERLRTLKKYIKKTPFSMLLRGQNLVGYRNYADDVCRVFVQRAAENGVDVFRTFDALNDYRNFETVVPAIKEAGKHFQGCICYTLTQPRLGGEVYNRDYYVDKARELASLGADSICIKDMAGLLSPYDAFIIISALKETADVPIHMHSHCTSGMAAMSQLKAIEAGVDIVDTCMTPYANRTSHPPVEPLVMTLLGTNRDTGFDIRHLVAINQILERDVLPKYRRLLSDEKVSITDINVLLHQTPGGMLSNLANQLREMDAIDRLDDVYAELPRVRKELGQPPLVTPTSQIVGVQTVNNVMFDTGSERYTRITDQVKDLCFGLYGRTPAPIDPAIRKKALTGYPRGEEPITCRPGEIIEPELDKARQDIKDISSDIDDVLLCALYPLTGKRFLKWKYGLEDPPPEVLPKTLEQAKSELDLIAKAKAGSVIPRPDKKAPENKGALRAFDVYVDGEYFKVEVGADGAPSVQAPPQPRTAQPPKNPAPAPLPAAPADGTAVTAPMPGMVVSVAVNQGDTVTAGDTVVVLEAMKMENAIPAPADGTVVQICVKSGDKVKKDDVLFVMA